MEKTKIIFLKIIDINEKISSKGNEYIKVRMQGVVDGTFEDIQFNISLEQSVALEKLINKEVDLEKNDITREKGSWIPKDQTEPKFYDYLRLKTSALVKKNLLPKGNFVNYRMRKILEKATKQSS